MNGQYIVNSFTLSEEDKARIINKEIDIIAGTFQYNDGTSTKDFVSVRHAIANYVLIHNAS